MAHMFFLTPTISKEKTPNIPQHPPNSLSNRLLCRFFGFVSGLGWTRCHGSFDATEPAATKHELLHRQLGRGDGPVTDGGWVDGLMAGWPGFFWGQNFVCMETSIQVKLWCFGDFWWVFVWFQRCLFLLLLALYFLGEIEMIQFDEHMFYDWVESKPPARTWWWLMVGWWLIFGWHFFEAKNSERQVEKMVRICEDEIFWGGWENWEDFVLVL